MFRIDDDAIISTTLFQMGIFSNFHQGIYFIISVIMKR